MNKIPLFPSSLELFRLVRTVADDLDASEKMSDADKDAVLAYILSRGYVRGLKVVFEEV